MQLLTWVCSHHKSRLDVKLVGVAKLSKLEKMMAGIYERNKISCLKSIELALNLVPGFDKLLGKKCLNIIA